MSRPQADPDTLLYKQECISILALSQRIRYPDEARNEHFIEATRNQLRKNFEKSIGREEYTLTENEKVKILTLSSQEHFYYVTVDKETPTNEVMKIIEEIKALVGK